MTKNGADGAVFFAVSCLAHCTELKQLAT
jgi:hypothetical protein